MDRNIVEAMRKGFETAFVDNTAQSNLAYKPQFVWNNYKYGQKVLSSIEDELLRCDEFSISVAFITMSGITPLLQTLKVLEKKNIKGRILTTDYLTFTDPKALLKLMEFKNLEVRVYEAKEEGFHTKGYIFKQEDLYRIITGSSNMTLGALTKNKEWNSKILSTVDGEYAVKVIEEFESLWSASRSRECKEVIEYYTTQYNLIKHQKAIAKQTGIPNIEQYRLKPNKMQIAFTNNLQNMIHEGEDKALLISATGTGKTYASAFALREINPKKALFLVHREQIAKQAIKSFKNVFGNQVEFGLLSGSSKEFGADYLFSTMQMMAKQEIHEKFARNEFDVIVIDEVHRAGANSYQKILEYFQPSLYLGMTASPDRTDGFDIYNLFDHNIAYEIRLQQAMEEDLLCPFHYFGITDLEIDGQAFNDDSRLRDFNQLVSDERVNNVIEKAKYYGYSGERVKGLIFCSRKSEARELSRKFNERGYKTEFIGGEDSQDIRERAIARLTADDSASDKLDYLFTVDIFNEGVDIPEINQVIMLRPTESPVVFVQQLGRGLRKAEDKEYVVILDFIGNYTNNFMIPIALSGDRTYNKDNIRRYIMEGERVIPGSSTIHFDEISKKKIFESIDIANFSDIGLIKENYTNLKNKLGRIPRLEDFEKYGEMDVLRMFENQSLGSYYKFLVKYEKEYKVRFSNIEEKFIEFLSKKLANGKRIHELELLKRAIKYSHGITKIWKNVLEAEYGIYIKDATIKNVKNILTNEFATGSSKNTYKECVFIDKYKDDIQLENEFLQLLENQEFKAMVMEIIDFGIHRYKKDYSERYKGTNLNLYQKYTYEDVCRLLEWESNEVPLNIGGYKYDSKTKTFPVFINYHKEDGISDTIRYEDHFVSENRLIAISKQSRTIQSEDIQNFLHAKERDIEVELFVRKNKDDKISKEFYYLGKMQASGYTKEFIMTNTTKSAVEIEWILDTPVREDIYQYIIKG